MYTNIGLADFEQLVADPIAAASQAQVWTPVDFLYLGSRDAVDKALQRWVGGGQLRGVDAACWSTSHRR
jgi:hypothetical protein